MTANAANLLYKFIEELEEMEVKLRLTCVKKKELEYITDLYFGNKLIRYNALKNILIELRILINDKEINSCTDILDQIKIIRNKYVLSNIFYLSFILNSSELI